jgi:Bacterial Ig-like domain/PKD domain
LSIRLRSGALVACALLAAGVVGSTALADDTSSPTMIVAVTPQTAAPGSDVTITATVTPATNPDSTGLAVNCDVSWSTTGGHADLIADATGLVFSKTLTVRGDAVPGGRVGSCTVTDDQLRSSYADYSFTVGAETDSPPTVTSHTPADGEADVAVDANIGITFSEPVDLADGWYSISCDGSGVHTASVSGSAGSYLLDPASDFANAEQCTVTLDSTLVTDQDGSPDQLTGPVSWSFTTVAAAANQPPRVSAGGRYTVDEGGSVQLAATGVDPEGGPLTYAWDLDNDGAYETAGRTPTFTADDGESSYTVGVRVTDDGGLQATATATIDVHNVAPTATFAAPATAFAGLPFTLSLTSPHDPSKADTGAGFTYAFDCGDGNYAASASCTASDVQTLTVRGTIQDKDGGTTTYTATVQVTVTYDSLCALVRAYSTDPKVADDLCAKLATAAAASTPTAHDGALGAFRNQADAKVGKGLTAAQAAQLELLSTRL